MPRRLEIEMEGEAAEGKLGIEIEPRGKLGAQRLLQSAEEPGRPLAGLELLQGRLGAQVRHDAGDLVLIEIEGGIRQEGLDTDSRAFAQEFLAVAQRLLHGALHGEGELAA